MSPRSGGGGGDMIGAPPCRVRVAPTHDGACAGRTGDQVRGGRTGEPTAGPVCTGCARKTPPCGHGGGPTVGATPCRVCAGRAVGATPCRVCAGRAVGATPCRVCAGRAVGPTRCRVCAARSDRQRTRRVCARRSGGPDAGVPVCVPGRSTARGMEFGCSCEQRPWSAVVRGHRGRTGVPDVAVDPAVGWERGMVAARFGADAASLRCGVPRGRVGRAEGEGAGDDFRRTCS